MNLPKKHALLLISCILLCSFGCKSMVKNIATGNKTDPIQLIKKHSLSTPHQLKALNSKISLSKFDDSYSVYQDEALYNQLNNIYLDIKNLTEEDYVVNAFDGRSNTNKRRELIEELLKLKNNIPTWLADRKKALQSLENEENRIAVSTKDAPQKIVSMFNKEEKPKNYSYVKNAFSFLPNWKVKISYDPVSDTASLLENFNPMDIEDPNGLAHSTSRVFINIPTHIDANEDYRIILGTIKSKFKNKYLISPSAEGGSHEALAEISDKVISNSGVSFSEQCIMVCKLTGTTTVPTLSGIKTISLVSVKGVISIPNSEQFYKYVVGHPNEFSPQKYVKLTIE